MANVVDGARNWPCMLNGVTDSAITVTIAGDNGLNAVCAGVARNGGVQDDGREYNVKLPGSFQAGTRIVTFKRR
jgi:hypothetical protein